MNEETIFAAALEKKSTAQRQAFLDEVCSGQPELRSAVEGLLLADAAAGSFMEHPPVGVEATVVSEAACRDTLNSNDWANSLRFLEPCDKPDRIGLLDQYEIIEVVGHGGMGAVMRAFDTKLSRVVAVKVMSPGLATNATAVKRFLREATTAASIHHDHVVTIHAVNDSHVPPYLVMQFIEGQTLQQKIDREGALGLKHILRIGSQSAAGLAAAHKLGVIHRDVKPANILLENGVERVKISDFGLARAADDAQMTQTGIIAGTPQYMSPEQAKGEPIDARSDLFSLGSVLYTMCTGRPAFRADNPVAVLRRVCDDTPRPIREINAEIPAWLEAIVNKLLAKNPDYRFQSVAEVAKLLEQCLAHVQERGVGVPPAMAVGWDQRAQLAPAHHRGVGVSPAKSSRRRWSIAAAAVLLLCAGLSLAESTGVTNVAATVIRIVRGDGTLVVEVDDPNIQVLLDGEEVVITGAGPKEIRLRPGKHELQTVKDGETAETKLVTITKGGRQVVKVAREEAVAPAPTSATPATTAQATTAQAHTGPVARRIAVANLRGSLSPDAHYLAIPDFLETGDLTVRDLATGHTRRLTNSPEDSNEFALSSQFSPDGQKLAYSWRNKENKLELRVIGFQGGEPQHLPIDGSAYPLLGWTPDGKSILFALSFQQRDFQLAIRDVANDSLRIVKTFRTPDQRPPRGEIKLSPDGRTIAYARPAQPGSAERDVFLLDVASGQETQVTTRAADEEVLAWAPEGQRLITAIARQGTWDAWISPVSDGRSLGNPALVKADLGGVVPLAVNSQGTFYYGLESGGPTIYTAVLNLETGTATPQPLAEEQLSALDICMYPTWSPSGEELAYQSVPRSESYQGDSLQRIKVVHAATGGSRVLETGVSFVGTLRWSQGGRSFLCSGKNVSDGRRGIYRIDAHTGEAKILIESSGDVRKGRGQAQSSADGRGLFYGQGVAIHYRDLETQTDRELLTLADSPFDDQFVPMFAVSPDGTQVATYAKEAGHDTFTIRIIPAQGGPPRELYRMEDGWYTRNPIVWTPDGRSLLFLRTGDNKTKRGLWQISSKGGEPRQISLSGFPDAEHMQDLAIHPDGKQIAFVHSDQGKFEIWALENFLPLLATQLHQVAANSVALPTTTNPPSATKTASPETATAQTVEPGWTQLFNGQDLTGWKTLQQQPGNWHVKDGILVAEGGISHLFSEKTYGEFHLRAEVRLLKGDSGIAFRSEFALPNYSQRTGLRYPGGYEADIADPQVEHSPGNTGTVRPLKPVMLDLAPMGEWFSFEIIAQDNHFVTKINGQIAADVVDPDRRAANGRLALGCGHSAAKTAVEFRKIEIKDLSSVLPESPQN